ncbi:MAG: Mut7-C ubiquitin/RNAse domain-containing protein [Thermoflexibacter sp.]|nr:Mut7-C ubiquitin/RNAse domain-containing protein [Thermoflexibacter sp.]
MKAFVSFFFHAELNDFLSIDKKSTPYLYHFEPNSTVKDSIEAQGIPHTEIEWIKANGQSVDFNYRLKNKDEIEVYPSSSKLSEELIVRPTLSKFTFIVDANVRKITKYMRMLGFDTITDEGIPDEEIAIISAEQGRILLTRDIGLLKRKNVVYGYFVRNEQVEGQVIEIINRYQLLDKALPFSICLTCNGKIAEIAQKDICEELPHSVREAYDTFYKCNACQKVYWKGSHFSNMQKLIDNLNQNVST